MKHYCDRKYWTTAPNSGGWDSCIHESKIRGWIVNPIVMYIAFGIGLILALIYV